MENFDKEVAQPQLENEDLPKGGFGIKNLETVNKDKKESVESIVNNTGIGPGEHPDLPEGSDIDAASS